MATIIFEGIHYLKMSSILPTLTFQITRMIMVRLVTNGSDTVLNILYIK